MLLVVSYVAEVQSFCIRSDHIFTFNINISMLIYFHQLSLPISHQRWTLSCILCIIEYILEFSLCHLQFITALSRHLLFRYLIVSILWARSDHIYFYQYYWYAYYYQQLSQLFPSAKLTNQPLEVDATAVMCTV